VLLRLISQVSHVWKPFVEAGLACLAASTVPGTG
jgi:hypothetical protein